MDPMSQNAFNEILRKLEALDEKMRQMDVRLGDLEKRGFRGDSQDLGAETPMEIPPEAVVPSETVLRGSVPPPIPRISPVPQTVFHDEETIMDLPEAPGESDPEPEVPIQQVSATTPSSFQLATAGLKPGTVPSRKPKESWEVRIATYWLPRIGLLFLALVCGLFAKEHAQGPLGKVIIAYVVSFGMMAVAIWKEKKYPQWAAPVLAGGLAFSYFASYAMGFVEPMRLLDSLGIKLAILAVNLALIFGIAHWKKSEVIGGTALLLGYLTTGVVGNDLAAFSSSLALSACALLFLWLNQWFTATAMAAVATYIAHFYVWRALPEAEARGAVESFWHHFMFLSLYFVVFAAAGLVGKKTVLMESRGADMPLKSRGNTFPKRHLLTVLTQTNVAAYLVGMIAVLKLTQVYWDRSWAFFFPVAALFGLLGLMFVGISSVQIVYLIAGTVCLSLGIIAVASPMWLPVFLAAQALSMLWFARGRYAEVWGWLSMAVLGYAGIYLLSGGAVDLLQISGKGHVRVIFPWWTHGAVTVIALIYAGRMELSAVIREKDPQSIFAYLISFAAVVPWIEMADLGDRYFLYGLAIPGVAAAMVWFSLRSLIPFVYAASIGFFVDWTIFRELGEWSVAPVVYWGALGGLGIVSALYVEKAGTALKGIARALWRVLYVWATVLIAVKIGLKYDGPSDLIAYLCVFTGLIGLGWAMRSAALGKVAFLLVPCIAGLASSQSEDLGPVYIIPTVIVMLAAAYPVALHSWRYRTGDSWPLVNQLGQAFVVFAAWALTFRTLTQFFGVDQILAHGLGAVMCASYAALGRFPKVVIVYGLCVLTIGFTLMERLEIALRNTALPGETVVSPAFWSVLGVLLIVAGERILLKVLGTQRAWSNPVELWLKPKTLKVLTGFVAISTLIFTVIALRTFPDLRFFYFTGAMVAAAFIWIVFGFLFNEPVYRKSGFVLLCIGILKGLIWDVLSLKETFYRIVSWSILGLLALAASYLYTKFRGQIGGEADVHELPMAERATNDDPPGS